MTTILFVGGHYIDLLHVQAISPVSRVGSFLTVKYGFRVYVSGAVLEISPDEPEEEPDYERGSENWRRAYEREAVKMHNYFCDRWVEVKKAHA